MRVGETVQRMRHDKDQEMMHLKQMALGASNLWMIAGLLQHTNFKPQLEELARQLVSHVHLALEEVKAT